MLGSAGVTIVNVPRDTSALREAAIAIDRASSELRGSAEKLARESWQALVLGGWKLVDNFERDGRRILIAQRNDSAGSRRGKVTARTRLVLARRAQGLSLKVIADELGISIATASRELARGTAALGVTTTAELARLVR